MISISWEAAYSPLIKKITNEVEKYFLLVLNFYRQMSNQFQKNADLQKKGLSYSNYYYHFINLMEKIKKRKTNKRWLLLVVWHKKISKFRSIFSELCFGLLFNVFYQITVDLKTEKEKKSKLIWQEIDG